MTDRKHELEQMLQATMGLGASAGASALRSVSRLADAGETSGALSQIAMQSSLSERAQTCMSVAAQAEMDGDSGLAELGWLQAMSFLNHLAAEAAEQDLSEAEDIQQFSRQIAGRVH